MVTATAAVDDCIMAVITSPTATSANTPTKPDHQPAPDSWKVPRVQPFGQSAHALLQRRQSKKHERKSGKGRTRSRHTPAPQKIDQRADEDHRQRGGGKRNAHADECNEPAGPSGANIRTEDEA
jgi:hypothetical protein